MRAMRVGLIGQPFKGMGDFALPFDVLQQTIGITTVHWDFKKTASLMPMENAPVVRAEMVRDTKAFDGSIADPVARARSLRAGLGVRRWLKENHLGAFTMNFLNITRASGFPTVPFLEASKGMARGIGYAGEGDVLTAGLTGALLAVFPQTTFTEIFCPDWSGNRLFLSHMGEVNLSLLNAKPRLFEMQYPYTNVGNPVVAAGTFKPGKAVLVNLAPQANNTYALIVALVEVCDVPDRPQENSIRGWIKPALPIADFLARYSEAGGTHHSSLVYGNVADILLKFGRLMGWKIITI
jgi:L-arabinose isomerase